MEQSICSSCPSTASTEEETGKAKLQVVGVETKGMVCVGVTENSLEVVFTLKTRVNEENII